MVTTGRGMRRRTALTAFGAALLSACGDERGATPATSPPAGNASPPRATPSTAPATGLPRVAVYTPLRGEVEPGCKTAAAAAVTAALTWQPGQQARALNARLLVAGALPSLTADLEALVDDHLASSLEIVYPQYGGLGQGRNDASVMLVGRQTWRAAAGAAPQTRELTIDVRLRKKNRRWAAEAAYVSSAPPAAAQPDPATRRLLQNDAVVLPAAAQADLLSAAIDPRLVDLLGVLSRRWRIHVQVLKSGHPQNVYGTDRVSNHIHGRAVDIWAIDDVPVLEQRPSVWSAVMREAASLGADEIGGPVDVDGRAGRPPYFTNDVHKDHVHVGFDTG